jgi:dTDP-glucose 4,6-dehydratase
MMIGISPLISEFDALPSDALDRLRAMRLDGARILVAGATGYVGTWILAALGWLNARCSARIEVHALARTQLDSPGDWLLGIASDVRQFTTTSHYDYVLHAALPSTAVAPHALPELQSVAINGTRQLLEAVRASNPRVLMLSSGAVYGLDHNQAVGEQDFAPIDPLSTDEFYALTKSASEALFATQARDYGLNHSVARLFTCMGIGYRSHSHMAHVSFVNSALRGDAVVVRGSGDPVRSYIYGADLAIWLLAALGHGSSGEAYNMGSADPASIRDLAHRIARHAPGGPCAVRILGDRQCDGRRTYYVPRVDKATSAFGLKIWTPLDTAIERTLQLSMSR